MKTLIFTFYILIGSTLFAQVNYGLLYLKGNYNKLIEVSQKLETPEDYYWNSMALNKQGKPLEAIKLIEERTVEFDDIKIVETLLADLLYSTGQYSKAKPLLAAYLDNQDRRIKYINILEFQEEFFTAIELLRKEIRIDSLNIAYLRHLGDDYLKIDSVELAKIQFNKILEINRNDQVIAIKLASLLIKNKDFDEAIEICNVGLLCDRTNKKLLKLKGIACFKKSDYINATYCFEYLYKHGSSSKFVLKHLGISELNIELFESSKEHLSEAYEIDPDDYETCFMLGRSYLNSSEPEVGLFYYNRVDSLLQPNPKTISAIYKDKQMIYSTLKNYPKALECYQKAYEYNPKPEYVFYMASLYQHRLENKTQALKEYERFISILPPKPDEDKTIRYESSVIVSLRKIAESNIILLKEELFFEGNSL